jgi:sulfonate transport system permease protein
MENSIAQSEVKEVNLQKIKFQPKRLLPWLIPVALIGGWQLASSMGVLASETLPSPLAVIQTGIITTKSGELPKNISISLYRATIGLLIGGSLGFVLGFLNGISNIARGLFDTTIQMFRNIPHVALIPLVILLLGIGETAKISLVAIGVMFPIYINTFHGIRSVDPELIEMGQSYGLTKRELFTKIIIPGALPTILMGLRYALGVMWTTLIVAETIAADSGIGYLATTAQDFMDMNTIILCIVIYALLGKLSDSIAKNIEKLALSWREVKGEALHE